VVVDDSSPFHVFRKLKKDGREMLISQTKWLLVVGPPPTNGRGVFVVFLSFCIGFYSILSVSRCANGPFFYLVFSFLVLF
jgi:hypothetical protein